MIRGVDYASVDRNSAPNFTLVRNAGIRFAILRKSYVLTDARGAIHCAPDPHYARDELRARDAGLVIGSYAFFSFAKGAPPAAEQVAAYRNAPGKIIPGKDLPPCIDVELSGRGIVDTGRTQAEAFAFLLELIAEVRRQFGVSPLLYSSHVQWADNNGLGGPDDAALDDCLYWAKTPYRLQRGQPMDAFVPRAPHVGPASWDPHGYWRVPRPWEDQGYWIQQYQGDAIGCPGFNSTVDLNLFHATSCADADAPRLAWVLRCLTRQGLYDGSRKLYVIPKEADILIRQLQSTSGLAVDGIIGPATFAKLCW